MAALEALTAGPVTDWPKRGSGGRQRGIQAVFSACQRAGLTAGPCTSDVQRLHAVFEVAAAHGLACVVVDYLALVCADPSFASRWGPSPGARLHARPTRAAARLRIEGCVYCSDPVEASLMDGHCVQRWASASLQSLGQRAAGACSAAFAPPAQAHERALLQLLGHCSSLVAVLEALGGQQRSLAGCAARVSPADRTGGRPAAAVEKPCCMQVRD